MRDLPLHLQRSGLVVPSGGGGGGGGFSIARVTGWSALRDPDTRYSAYANDGSGGISWTFAGDSVIYDGFSEMPGTDVQVVSIPGCENFDPSLHDLRVFVNYTTFSDDAGAAPYGIGLFVIDDTMLNRATASGGGFGLERVSATARRATSLGSSSLIGGTANLTTAPYSRAILDFAFANDTGATVGLQGVSRYRYSGGLQNGTDPGFGYGLSADPEDYHLALCGFHRNTTSDTPSFAVTVDVLLNPRTEPS